MEQLLSFRKAAWEKANLAGKTMWSWEQEEAETRRLHTELSAMSDEDRDMAVLKGHLERANMLKEVLAHIDNVLMPKAIANEFRKPRAKARKKKKGRKK